MVHSSNWVRWGMAVLLALCGYAPSRVQAESCGCRASDFDDDLDVDQSDFAHLQMCLTGYSVLSDSACADADLDGNNLVNAEDLRAFIACMSGPGVVPQGGALDNFFISEFIASNGTGLVDEDGEHSDWIEIYNPCIPGANLEGWYLTDDATNLTKWRFPSVIVGKNKFLIIFASGKNRKDPNGKLHTNFKLANEGEYLALVAPDGETVVQAFQPTYPEQLPNVAYGLAQAASKSIQSRSEVKYHVPTSGDSSLGTSWTSPDFVDSTWQDGISGLGFSSVAPAFKVDVYKANISTCDMATAKGVITNTSQQEWAATGTSPIIDFFNSGGAGNYSNNLAFPGMENGADVENYVVQVTGTIVIPSMGEWTFGVNSDDGFELTLTRAGTVFETSFPEPRSTSDTLAVFEITEVGTYNVNLVFYECGGGSALEFFAAPGSYESFNAEAFDLVGDTASGGLAVGVLGGDIATDIGAEMRDVNSSVWVRVPFQVDSPTSYEFMALRMKYEDGYVAYLNGREIARRNSPGTLAWNSAAASDRSITEAAEYEEIDVTTFMRHLVPGQNLLAVHGLNDAANDPDFLVLPELVLGNNVLLAQYLSPPTPGTFNVAGDVDFVRSLAFSTEHGFFNTPFQLAITTPTPDVEIRYTLDGSTPTESNGTVYTGPITISQTSVVRAAGFKLGYITSRVTTRTYLFLADVVQQSPSEQAPGPNWPAPGSSVNGQDMDYGMDPTILNDARYANLVDDALLAIPTISMVTDLANLFSSTKGIYVNAGGDGQAWERPASLELIHPDGTEGFQIDAGVRIRGGYSRSGSNPKHAFRFFFRSEYGSGKLAYPLFGDEGAAEFDKIDLATAQNYSWSFEYGTKNTFLRDFFSRDTQRDMGKPYARGRYYHLYINGVYWGLFYTDERCEADYAATYFGGTDNDYDVIKVAPDNGYTIYATDGDVNAYHELWLMCGETGSSSGYYPTVSNETYQQIRGCNPDGTRNPAYKVRVDIDNLIDYILCTIFVADPDGPAAWGGDFPNNFFAIGDRAGLMGFRFFRHDAEHSMGCSTGDPNEQRTGPYIAGWTFDRFNPWRIHQDLITCTDYRIRFSDRVYQTMFDNGPLTTQNNLNRLIARRDQIDLAVVAESARWGDSKGEPPRNRIDTWLPAVNWILNNYLPNRTSVVAQQLRNKGWFKDPPTTSVAGGSIPVGTEVVLSNTSSPGTIYYTLDGIDPRLPGGAVAPTARTYQPTTTSVTLVPKGARWKYLDNGSDQGTAWYAKTFDDSAWKGPQAARLGYGNDGETSPKLSYGPSASNKYMTYYFRSTFAVGDTSNITELKLRLLRDDGAMVYINGTRVPTPHSVDNMPDTWNYLTRASSAGEEQTYYEASVSPTMLIPNTTNTIAVEVHQVDPTSTDLGFDLELVATKVSTTSDKIIINTNTRLIARVLNGAEWSAAKVADYMVGPANLYINELMADNKVTLEDPDEAGEFPDWFEVYNPNPFPVSMGGMYVTDMLGSPTMWKLPNDVIIQPGEFLVFYADEDTAQGSTHVGFKLSNNGEAVGLYDRDGVTPIDTVSFGVQLKDVSYGRYPDATGGWGKMATPTPWGPNSTLVGQ
ncbi:MAG: lamin tail domain-containing protein [Phycisphaerae bacterium]|nr:lamin tail domain-containing protein [Phycisphaerae bacterium]